MMKDSKLIVSFDIIIIDKQTHKQTKKSILKEIVA